MPLARDHRTLIGARSASIVRLLRNRFIVHLP
jgi:hypothetical protein